MQVNFYGTYRLITGGKTIEFSHTPDGTLLDLLHAITAQFPSLHNEIFDERDNLFASVPIFINGRNPRLLAAGVNSILQPEDVLSIFSPIASGRINIEDITHSL